jgi:NADH:ubiquinone oxidoreductase subunit 6 (subunit J)
MKFLIILFAAACATGAATVEIYNYDPMHPVLCLATATLAACAIIFSYVAYDMDCAERDRSEIFRRSEHERKSLN